MKLNHYNWRKIHRIQSWLFCLGPFWPTIFDMGPFQPKIGAVLTKNGAVLDWGRFQLGPFWLATILKMLCLYLLGQNCLHLTFKPYWSSDTYSRKYETLSNIIIYACMNITEKMNLLKMCVPQIRVCLFTIRPIASKQFNSLTTIVSLSWLGSTEVLTNPLWMREVLGSIPGSGKGFYALFCCFIIVYWYFWSQNTLFVTKKCNFFCNVYLFSVLNILQDLWPIMRV